MNFPEEQPTPLSLDNRTERFLRFYSPIIASVQGPRLGSGEQTFNKEADEFYAFFSETINHVFADIDASSSMEQAKKVALKKELLHTVIVDMEESCKSNVLDTRSAIALECARDLAKKYMSEEFFSEDTRKRKTEERALSVPTREALNEFSDMIRRIPDGLKQNELGISFTELEQSVQYFLEEKYREGDVGMVKEVVEVLMRRISERNTAHDVDERWMHAFMAIEHFCETHFPGMIVEDEETEDEEGEFF